VRGKIARERRKPSCIRRSVRQFGIEGSSVHRARIILVMQ
jgi:hypothetical protein